MNLWGVTQWNGALCVSYSVKERKKKIERKASLCIVLLFLYLSSGPIEAVPSLVTVVRKVFNFLCLTHVTFQLLILSPSLSLSSPHSPDSFLFKAQSSAQGLFKIGLSAPQGVSQVLI